MASSQSHEDISVLYGRFCRNDYRQNVVEDYFHKVVRYVCCFESVLFS